MTSNLYRLRGAAADANALFIQIRGEHFDADDAADPPLQQVRAQHERLLATSSVHTVAFVDHMTQLHAHWAHTAEGLLLLPLRGAPRLATVLDAHVATTTVVSYATLCAAFESALQRLQARVNTIDVGGAKRVVLLVDSRDAASLWFLAVYWTRLAAMVDVILTRPSPATHDHFTPLLVDDDDDNVRTLVILPFQPWPKAGGGVGRAAHEFFGENGLGEPWIAFFTWLRQRMRINFRARTRHLVHSAWVVPLVGLGDAYEIAAQRDTLRTAYPHVNADFDAGVAVRADGTSFLINAAFRVQQPVVQLARLFETMPRVPSAPLAAWLTARATVPTVAFVDLTPPVQWRAGNMTRDALTAFAGGGGGGGEQPHIAPFTQLLAARRRAAQTSKRKRANDEAAAAAEKKHKSKTHDHQWTRHDVDPASDDDIVNETGSDDAAAAAVVSPPPPAPDEYDDAFLQNLTLWTPDEADAMFELFHNSGGGGGMDNEDWLLSSALRSLLSLSKKRQ